MSSQSLCAFKVQLLAQSQHPHSYQILGWLEHKGQAWHMCIYTIQKAPISRVWGTKYEYFQGIRYELSSVFAVEAVLLGSQRWQDPMGQQTQKRTLWYSPGNSLHTWERLFLDCRPSSGFWWLFFFLMQWLFYVEYVLNFSYCIMDTYGNTPGAHQDVPSRNGTAMFSRGMNDIRSWKPPQTFHQCGTRTVAQRCWQGKDPHPIIPFVAYCTCFALSPECWNFKQ